MHMITDTSAILIMSSVEKEKLRDAVRMSMTVCFNYLMDIEKVPERRQTVIAVEGHLATLRELLEVLARE